MTKHDRTIELRNMALAVLRARGIDLFGSPVFARAGKTDPPSSSYPLAELGGHEGADLIDDARALTDIGKRPSAPAALHRLYRMGGAFAVVIVADGDDGSGQWRTMLIGSDAAEAA